MSKKLYFIVHAHHNINHLHTPDVDLTSSQEAVQRYLMRIRNEFKEISKITIATDKSKAPPKLLLLLLSLPLVLCTLPSV